MGEVVKEEIMGAGQTGRLHTRRWMAWHGVGVGWAGCWVLWGVNAYDGNERGGKGRRCLCLGAVITSWIISASEALFSSYQRRTLWFGMWL